MSIDKLVNACNQVAVNVAGGLNSGLNSAASSLNSAAASTSSWIEYIGAKSAAMGRSPPPPPEPFLRRNRLAVILGLGAAGAAIYYLLCSRPQPRICGSRAPDGGRQDVVVIVGSPSEPLIRVVLQELNLRSFIVYVCTASEADKQYIAQLHCSDIRAIDWNPMDPVSVAGACASLGGVLTSKVTTMEGGEPYFLNLAGILLIPDLAYPQGPLEMISQVDLETSIASKLVAPLFSLRCGVVDLARQFNSRIILLNPSIIANLSPAYHLMESIFTAALDHLALTMYRELRPQGIPFSQIKLGSFDINSDFSGHHHQVVNTMRADILAWPEKVRHLYAGSYLESSYLQTNRARGSSINELHQALARMLTVPRPSRVQHVGRYSYAYEWLHSHVPEFVLTWALA